MAANVSVFVDPAKIRSSVSSLRNTNNKLTEKLENVRSIMKSTNNESTYSSDASEALIEKFERMANKRIPEFNSIVEDYAKALDNVAETHENLVAVTKTNLESSVEEM